MRTRIDDGNIATAEQASSQWLYSRTQVWDPPHRRRLRTVRLSAACKGPVTGWRLSRRLPCPVLRRRRRRRLIVALRIPAAAIAAVVVIIVGRSLALAPAGQHIQVSPLLLPPTGDPLVSTGGLWERTALGLAPDASRSSVHLTRADPDAALLQRHLIICPDSLILR